MTPRSSSDRAGGATTLEDIAREAGVSRATVSLVARGSPLVAAATRERVRATMERLGYRPNRMAASLRSKQTHILGLIVSDLTWPPYAHMAIGVEEAVEAAGYSVIVANSYNNPGRERRHLALLSHALADGALVTPVRLAAAETEHLRALVELGFPLVTLYREVEGLAADFCGTDVYGAARRLVGYLAGELGHRAIALFSSEVANSTNPARLAGWRDELTARGLPAGDGLVQIVPGAHDGRADGGAAVRALLASGRRVTAVVCVNDIVALGVLRAARLAGVRVPDELSVAGMGGFADAWPQPLTTMADD